MLNVVQCVMGLRAQSQRWKSMIDSSLEGVAVRATCKYAQSFSGPGETPVNYFKWQFRPIASVLSGTWIVREPRDLDLLRNIAELSSDQVLSLVVHLRRAKRVVKAKLCDFGWYYVYCPPLRACSVEFLTHLLGPTKAVKGFLKPQ